MTLFQRLRDAIATTGAVPGRRGPSWLHAAELLKSRCWPSADGFPTCDQVISSCGGIGLQRAQSVAAIASATASTAAAICSSLCSLVRKNRIRACDSRTAG